eukprot:3916867-Lingulodinium_polyedra.AAC.1
MFQQFQAASAGGGPQLPLRCGPGRGGVLGLGGLPACPRTAASRAGAPKTIAVDVADINNTTETRA